MKIDGAIGFDPTGIATSARRLEDAGYDGAWSAETGRDPFLPLAVAADATERLELVTGIAVAFARNPMTLAMSANDLHQLSKGRFILGLGSQIKPHITKRYSMPWSHPAPRMRELVLAIRAIWKNWEDGTPLDFRGEFYTHTLMTPFFNPGPNPYGNPKIVLAAVGALMAEVAGEAADGLLVHPFTTARYLAEVSVPALERGATKAGKTRGDLVVALPGFVVTGSTDEQTAQSAKAANAQIALYGSTPAPSSSSTDGGTSRPSCTHAPSAASGRRWESSSTTRSSRRSRSSPHPSASPTRCSSAGAASSTGSASTRLCPTTTWRR
jgi:probable F420-dependent oxidoreductase